MNASLNAFLRIGIALAIGGLALFVSAPTLASTCDADDSRQVHPWNDPSAFATPKKVIPPKFPLEPLQKKITAQVESALRINEHGRVLEVLSLKSNNGDNAFEQAVREVVDDWTFEPWVDCECKPVEFTARVTIWFEFKGDEPSISISRADRPQFPGLDGKPLKLLRGEEFLKAVKTSFPKEAKRAGKGGTVHAMLKVDVASGVVLTAKSVRVDAEPAYQDVFARGAELALKKARYDLADYTGRGPLTTCFALTYVP